MLNNYITAPNTLVEKIYQLIISRLDGEGISSKSYQEKIFELVKKGIGGFIVFGGKKDEIKYFIDMVQSIAEIPLFIASDVERGVGQQIQNGTILPCQMAIAAAINKNSPEHILILHDVIKTIADEAMYIGINMPLIPVLDVNQNPDNPIICTRAFSGKPEDVAWFGSEYIKTLEGLGLISCAKHFPGHGDTSSDSHILLPVISKSYEDLMSIDIVPFEEAIRTGVSSIMVGHLSIPAIDYRPASLSKSTVTDILRGELGFDGLILTDALNMNALKDIENAPVQCIKAGVDMLLHPVDPDLTVKELVSAVESKEINGEQIDAAVNRILKTKVKLLNTTTPLFPPLVRGEIKRGKVDYRSQEKLSTLITEMSITSVKNTTGILPISERSRTCLVFSGDNKFFESSPLKEYFGGFSVISDKSKQDLISKKIAIFAIFTSVAAFLGSSGIDDDEISRIKKLIRKTKNSIIISFGSPYVLRHFREADVLIAAYEPTEQAQKAVIKCLKGEMDFNGRLLVRITDS